MESEVWQRARAAPERHVEVPFAVQVPTAELRGAAPEAPPVTILQGVVDLAYRVDGGWELVEKFDDGRLRFKRPAASRRKDAMLPAGYDPYRTRYGISEAALALWIVTIIMGLTGILVAVGTYLQW